MDKNDDPVFVSLWAKDLVVSKIVISEPEDKRGDMARIVEEVPVVEKRAVCRDGCGKTVAYVPNDVHEYHGTDISGGPDGQEWVNCPGCRKKIIIRSW